MKTRILPAVVPIVVLLAACGSDAPTAARAPERAALDGGSLGPGHGTGGQDSVGVQGGSLGPGH